MNTNQQKWQDLMCEKILPSGSGFDCKWEHVKTQKNGLEIFETYYHNMDYHGYYDGYTKIRLKIDPENQLDFTISLKGKKKYTYQHNREYYEDTIYHYLTNFPQTLN